MWDNAIPSISYRRRTHNNRMTVCGPYIEICEYYFRFIFFCPFTRHFQGGGPKKMISNQYRLVFGRHGARLSTLAVYYRHRAHGSEIDCDIVVQVEGHLSNRFKRFPSPATVGRWPYNITRVDRKKDQI